MNIMSCKVNNVLGTDQIRYFEGFCASVWACSWLRMDTKPSSLTEKAKS